MNPESQTEMLVDVYTPSRKLEQLHKDYQRALKDLTLSRLDEFDMLIVRMFNVIIDGERNMGMYDAAAMDEAEFLVWCAGKRAIGGKERDAVNTQNQNINADYHGAQPPAQISMVQPK